MEKKKPELVLLVHVNADGRLVISLYILSDSDAEEKLTCVFPREV